MSIRKRVKLAYSENYIALLYRSRGITEIDNYYYFFFQTEDKQKIFHCFFFGGHKNIKCCLLLGCIQTRTITAISVKTNGGIWAFQTIIFIVAVIRLVGNLKKKSKQNLRLVKLLLGYLTRIFLYEQ